MAKHGLEKKEYPESAGGFPVGKKSKMQGTKGKKSSPMVKKTVPKKGIKV